ncbi:MAG: DUF998 domain-containing protein [Acidimicrobiales bacterium]
MERRGDLAALGLVVGPVAFVAAWVVGGVATPGYSPVDDAISRIAAQGAPNRWLMTAGFVAYGVAVLVGSGALRRSPLRPGWALAAVNGVATLAVALTPLDRSELVDSLHGLSATVGYVALAALPIACAPALRSLGHRRAAAASVAAGLATAACLVTTTVTDANGLFQRLGLGIGDVWLIAAGTWLYRLGSQDAQP